jgi:polyisoprenoid-binding protein YceI
MKTFFSLILMFCLTPALANVVYFEPDSEISYKGYHPAHNWIGTSTSFKGGIICKENSFEDCIIKIVAPITSFDSGNSSRDSNMLLYTKSKDFPSVIFISDKFDIVGFDKINFEISGTLDFNGLKNKIKTTIQLFQSDESIIGKSNFKIFLDDYEVEKPQLLFIPISNEIDIEANLIIKNTFLESK